MVEIEKTAYPRFSRYKKYLTKSYKLFILLLLKKFYWQKNTLNINKINLNF